MTDDEKSKLQTVVDQIKTMITPAIVIQPPVTPAPIKVDWNAIGAAMTKYNTATGLWWTGSYDALLTWAANPATTPAQPPVVVPVAPSSSIGAKAFVQSLGLGLNIERAAILNITDADLDYYLSVGYTHLRIFIPWNGGLDFGLGTSMPSSDAIKPWFDFAKRANKKGLKIFLDCTDVLELNQASKVSDHLINCIKLAASLDPALSVIGAVNEHAGGTNADWNAFRKTWLTQLRAGLPNHILSTGPAYWKDFQHLWDVAGGFELSTDKNVIYDVHHYVVWDWTYVASNMAAWQAAHGDVPVVFGESGSGWGNNGAADEFNQANWIVNLPKQTVLAALSPSLWSINNGSWWKLNNSTDYRHTAQLEPVIKKLAADIKTAKRL